MQIQGQLKMQAAELEAKDRRMAEAEAGRREDQQYNRMMQKERQTFLAELNRLGQEYGLAKEKRDRKAQKETLQMQLDNVTAQGMLDAETARNTNKALVATAKMMLQKETAQEKLVTTIAEEGTNTQDAQIAYEHKVGLTKRKALLDKRMDLPVGGEK
jgi:hypothetical protein